MRTQAFGCSGPLLVGLVVSMFAFGCAGTREVDHSVVEMEEARLMRPFSAKQTLVAKTFDITMTANFFGRLTPLLRSHTHRTEREGRADGGAVHTFIDEVPGNTPMQFEFGETNIFVFERMQIEVLGGRHELTLNANGEKVTLHTANSKRELGTVEIRDGVFRRRR